MSYERGPKPDGQTIKLAGTFHDYMIVEIEHHPSSCGDLRGGVGIRFSPLRKDEEFRDPLTRLRAVESGAGFVLDWEDFKAAYEMLARVRAAKGLP
jgi:hypothetical protein